MSRIFFVFELFQKKNDRNNFFENFNVFFDFRNYDIKNSNKLIILIANVSRFRVFHDRKNEAWYIFIIFYIVQKIFFFRKFLKNENHWLSKFLIKILHQWSVFSSKKRNVCFFKSLKSSMYHIWIVSRKQVDRLILIVSISYVIIASLIFFHEHEYVSIIYVSVYLNDIVKIVEFFEFEIEKIHIRDFERIFWKNFLSRNIHFYDSILNKNNKHRHDNNLNIFFR